MDRTVALSPHANGWCEWLRAEALFRMCERCLEFEQPQRVGVEELRKWIEEAGFDESKHAWEARIGGVVRAVESSLEDSISEEVRVEENEEEPANPTLPL